MFRVHTLTCGFLGTCRNQGKCWNNPPLLSGFSPLFPPLNPPSHHLIHLLSCLQGLTLAIPEMVPFRLTQSLVDAFGVSGYEGAYRRACEVTLQVTLFFSHVLL